MVIAKTALGIPDALLAVAGRPPEIGAARSLAAQRDFLTCENARSKNRLRSILLESCPEFEAQADLSDPATLKLMAAVGGPWSISEASSRQGNRRLKNLLVFSCNCLARSRNRWGEYYARCRDGGMPHGKALKAVARKRLEVIYAIVGDKVPYAA